MNVFDFMFLTCILLYCTKCYSISLDINPNVCLKSIRCSPKTPQSMQGPFSFLFLYKTKNKAPTQPMTKVYLQECITIQSKLHILRHPKCLSSESQWPSCMSWCPILALLCYLRHVRHSWQGTTNSIPIPSYKFLYDS